MKNDMAIKACLVAVSEYNDIRLSTIPCKNDLYALSSALIKGLNVSQDQISMYGTNGKVLKEEFVGAIVDILKQCSETDMLIFYFSGHGGNGNIYFTDGAFSLQSLVDCLKNINKQNKLIVLDCCYAGDFVLDGEDNLDNYISIFNNSNCAVLASSRFNETSEISREKGISLCTSFLCDAITYRPLIRKGRKSLDDIINFIYFLSKKWGESHKSEQHPVFRSSLSGTIYFPVEEYHPYYTEKFYLECDDYIIYAVEPLHTNQSKRYCVKVILRGEKDEQAIADITHDIVRHIRYINIFKKENFKIIHQDKPAKLIFCYFGYDEEDVHFASWKYRSVWVDIDQNKDHWYKKTKDSKIVNDIWIQEQKWYSIIKKMQYTEMTKEKFIETTKQYLDKMVIKAREFIRIYREYKNGMISEQELITLVEPILVDINFCYFQFGNMPIGFLELKEWFDLCFLIASTISELSLYYRRENLDKWSRKNREQLIELTIGRYQEELDRLQQMEKINS